jgi:hypothetical protein
VHLGVCMDMECTFKGFFKLRGLLDSNGRKFPLLITLDYEPRSTSGSKKININIIVKR